MLPRIITLDNHPDCVFVTGINGRHLSRVAAEVFQRIQEPESSTVVVKRRLLDPKHDFSFVANLFEEQITQDSTKNFGLDFIAFQTLLKHFTHFSLGITTNPHANTNIHTDSFMSHIGQVKLPLLDGSVTATMAIYGDGTHIIEAVEGDLKRNSPNHRGCEDEWSWKLAGNDMTKRQAWATERGDFVFMGASNWSEDHAPAVHCAPPTPQGATRAVAIARTYCRH